MDTKQPEALRLANMLEKPGYGWHSTPAECAAELQRLQSENDTLRAGYDAARLEIESLQAQAQQCGAGAGCCAQAARIEELEAQLEAVGAGGVGPLRKRCLHQISESQAQPVAWAIFAENGHCRMWTQNKGHADVAAKDTGLPLTALYAAPQPAEQEQPVALLVRKKSWLDGQWECAPKGSGNYGIQWADERMWVYAAPQPPAQAGEYPEPSPTAGMNIAQRILHVGGRNNAAGYVEFGGTQAVEALVRQVLRDRAATWQPIATAPIDGKKILLRSKRGRIADGIWSAANSSAGFWAWAYVCQEPVEWMPLPLPVANAARGAAQAAPVDAERLDYLQECGATVEVLPGRPGWTFRIGGLHGTVHRSVRAAIDAARAAQKGGA